MENDFDDIPHSVGDVIDQRYEIKKILGIGGFGVVYLVFSYQNRQYYALKTILHKNFEDSHTRNRFLTEAEVWINLGNHPYIVRALFIEQIKKHLYLGLEYIAPNKYGFNTLQHYLKNDQSLSLKQILLWSIQFCYGM